MSDERPLSVQEAAARAGVSVDGIRRAYRAGRLPAYRPAGQRRVVIRAEDLDAWAFSEETLVAPAPAPASGALQAVDDADPPTVRPPARRRSRPPSPRGSVASLLEIERRA
ncbi:MAG TPA: excisionase family DNA-binding protein [Solirubrobacteraceae bacterium]|nr:excisionase family DNA-binding protein [Solirubrobacteraceae bacterium]